ncbi:MAG: glutamate-5-semialdehyde dehydrogenase [Oscillospiraceae bacterium]|nr:glutamate-5-semialdehyde dehydrogenase [Oscillospiraceae bacterium]
MTTLEQMEAAKQAAPLLARADTKLKNEALFAMAEQLTAQAPSILQANAADLAAAQGRISPVMLDRLALNEYRIADMSEGVRQVAALPDPVGEVLARVIRPNGLLIEKTAAPLGVIAIIYESRPNVTSDAAALCVKSGNACILRGGKEAFQSASAIAAALQNGLAAVGLPRELVQLVQDTTRASAAELMQGVGYIDLLIPRGGAGLIRACTENARVPCIQTGTGICHIYVDRAADLAMALSIVENAKTSRPSVCNAAEVCLVHRDIVADFLPMLHDRLVTQRAEKGAVPVEFRADVEAVAYLGVPAQAQDFDTEFLDYIMAVKTVSSVDEAIAHIAAHSTGHSEAIVTADAETAEYFVRLVDSAAVYVNASTRFTDGGEFGLGCEMGISTQKLHARGPMGLRELTTYKYIVRGNGQIR